MTAKIAFSNLQRDKHFMKRAFLQIAMLLLATCSLVTAHPPKFHRPRGAVTVVQKSAGPSVSELDRQIAFFQFEFLADVALRCPVPCHRDVVQQLIEEQRLAVQIPQALPHDQLVASRETIYEAAS